MVVAPTFGQALLAVMLDTLGGIVGIAVADPKEPRKREREREARQFADLYQCFWDQAALAEQTLSDVNALTKAKHHQDRRPAELLSACNDA